MSTNPRAEQFVNDVLPAAIAIQLKHGLPAAAIAAQACLETGFGQFVPKDANTGQFSYNLFGIKGTGPAGSVSSRTWEVYNGVKTYIMANFKAFHSYEESFDGYAVFIKSNSRYRNTLAMTDPDQYLTEIHRAGYATDPAYVRKLQNIMDAFRLRERAKEMVTMAKPEPWMEKVMEEAKKAGLITSDHNAVDPSPKWFVLAVALNLLKVVKKQ